MTQDSFDSLKLLCNIIDAIIIREREVEKGVQITISQTNQIVHVIAYKNGNYLVQGTKGTLLEILRKWANKFDELTSSGWYDLPSSWREWNTHAHWLTDYIKTNGQPDEQNITHEYRINREILFHDYMLRNTPSHYISFTNLTFVVQSWMKRFCFMNHNVNKLLDDVANNIQTGGYYESSLDNIPFGVAADSLSYILAHHCPNKFVNIKKQFVCPQTKSDYGDCLLSVVDAIYPYCTDQKMLAYTKGNFTTLLKYGYDKLKWYDIKPSTPIEEKMSDGLKNAGILTIPQFQAHSPEHRYKIDFVIKTSDNISIANFRQYFNSN